MTKHQRVEDLLKGIEVDFVHAPQHFDTDAEYLTASLKWSVTIARGRASMTVDYAEGLGLIEGLRLGRTMHDAERATRIIRDGKLFPDTNNSFKGITTPGTQAFGGKPIRTPKLIDVMWCLVMDASVLDSGGFEEWASDLGYDEDSRKAEETYRQCLEQSLKLKRIVDIDALREAYDETGDF